MFGYTPEEREGLIGLLQPWDFGGPVLPMPLDHLWKLHEQAATCLLLLVPLRESPPAGSALVGVTVTAWDREILRHRIGREPPGVELIDLATGRCWPVPAMQDGDGGLLIFGVREGVETAIVEEPIEEEGPSPAWEEDGPDPVPPSDLDE
jgi:hypothetical protein